MTHPVITLGATALWEVTFVSPANRLVGHRVPAVPVPPRVLLHMLTWPDEWVDGRVAVTQTWHDHILVVDRYLGTLPLVAVDPHVGRAVGEDWFAKLRNRRENPGGFKSRGRHEAPAEPFDPHNPEHVVDWATRIADRTPSVRLITEVTWPPGLLPTPFHPRS